MIAGKHALVTGGGRGIGLAITRALAERGARVSVVSRSVPLGASAFFSTQADVADDASVAQAFERCREANGAIAILVNNAGIAESAPIARTDRAMWDRVIATNLTGTYVCTRHVAAEMLAANWGRVVNVASIAGLFGAPYISAYCASKHGVVGFTRALAAEWSATGVTANAVCPGYTQSDMLDYAIRNIVQRTGMTADQARAQLAQTNPGSRIVSPEEVAAAVVGLCERDDNGKEIVLPGD